MEKALWNPWHGCHKCSAGCANCYVFFLDSKRDIDTDNITRSKTNFELPLKKTKCGAYKIPDGTEVATCFTSDFFIKEADKWRDEAWTIIKARKNVRFLICTKRISRIMQCLPSDWGDGYENVAIAVSCENQNAADLRLPYLLSAPIKHRYIFLAPILEYVCLNEYLKSGQIEMVSVGGESYANARECDFDWIRRIYADCAHYGVKFDFHQTGSNFIYKGKRYTIEHRSEYRQAKKAMEMLSGEN